MSAMLRKYFGRQFAVGNSNGQHHRSSASFEARQFSSLN
jgi:hypothetical protein